MIGGWRSKGRCVWEGRGVAPQTECRVHAAGRSPRRVITARQMQQKRCARLMLTLVMTRLCVPRYRPRDVPMNKLVCFAGLALSTLITACNDDNGPCLTTNAVRDKDGICECPAGMHTSGNACVPNDASADVAPSSALDAGKAETPSRVEAGRADGAINEASTSLPPGKGPDDTAASEDAGLTASSSGAVDASAANGSAVDAGVLPPACIAVPEVCDGTDNDCDGTIDNGGVKNECGACGTLEHAKGESCSNGGQGPCAQPGTYQCMGETTICSAPPPTASVEICDGIDNDCDGTVDDGITKNACKGCAVLDHALKSSCTDGNGECQVSGTWECVGTEAVVCTAKARAPAAEVCDGKDNDCDGAVDEFLANACGGPCGAAVPNEDCSTPGDDNCNGQSNEGCAVCGDGRITGGEECDPAASGWSPWSCSSQCKRNTMYAPCATQADCAGNVGLAQVVCNVNYGVCSIGCTQNGVSGDASGCSRPPGDLVATCLTLNEMVCVATGCDPKTNAGCAVGSACVGSGVTAMCLGCDSPSACPAGKTCVYNESGGTFGVCK